MKTVRRVGVLGFGILVLGGLLWGVWHNRGRGQPAPAVTRLSAESGLEIVRRPAPLAMLRNRGALTKLPSYDPKSGKNWQVDLRGRDVTALDLRERLADLRFADFDSGTRWPERRPAGFEPRAILELNRSPGLGVRALHARGVTGAGVGIGIIDQALLVEHGEYRERLRCYEEIHWRGEQAQMHGPAVASIAVGKTVGVAPAADLYYIAEMHGERKGAKFEWDFTWLAQSITRMLEINAGLPSARKIRVISISVGWSPPQKGHAETMAAVEQANRAGVFVISTALSRTHGLEFHGLGRDQMSDPERPESYGPGQWWAQSFWGGVRFAPGQRLLVPMDARTTASPTGADDYVYYSTGGWSWSVPWIAGLYALACQVRPEITPAVFWAEALRTGRRIRIKWKGEEVEFGTITDPVALIEGLQQAARSARR
jgi:hypothetical protein